MIYDTKYVELIRVYHVVKCIHNSRIATDRPDLALLHQNSEHRTQIWLYCIITEYLNIVVQGGLDMEKMYGKQV